MTKTLSKKATSRVNADLPRFVTVSNEITKSEKGYKQTWAANIFDVQVDLDELDDGQQIDLEPVQSIAQDNLLNAIWRPDESSNPALLLISSGMEKYGKVSNNDLFY